MFFEYAAVLGAALIAVAAVAVSPVEAQTQTQTQIQAKKKYPLHRTAPRARVTVAPRSFLDAGTEVRPGDRKFTDYAFPPSGNGGIGINAVTNTGGKVGWDREPFMQPLPAAAVITPGSSPPPPLALAFALLLIFRPFFFFSPPPPPPPAKLGEIIPL